MLVKNYCQNTVTDVVPGGRNTVMFLPALLLIYYLKGLLLIFEGWLISFPEGFFE